MSRSPALKMRRPALTLPDIGFTIGTDSYSFALVRICAMHALLSLITAASLILHLGLGCRAHHAHASEATAKSDQLAAMHMHPDSDHSTDSSQPENQDCQEPSCVFLSGVKVILTHDLAPLATAVVSTGTDFQLCERYSPRSRTEAEMGHQVPMRLHLYYQILLI